MNPIDTARLTLRPLTMADLEPLQRLQQDPQMMRYMGDGHVHDEIETEAWLRWHVDLLDVDGYSLFAADLKPETKFVGWIGVTKPYWFPDLLPTPEIGWFIDRRYWGAGAWPPREQKRPFSSPSPRTECNGSSASTTPRTWPRGESRTPDSATPCGSTRSTANPFCDIPPPGSGDRTTWRPSSSLSVLTSVPSSSWVRSSSFPVVSCR